MMADLKRDVIVAPVRRIEYFDDVEIDWDWPDLIVLASKNSLRALEKAPRSLEFYVVGASLSIAMNDLGFSKLTKFENMAKLIAALQHKNKRILHLSGRPFTYDLSKYVELKEGEIRSEIVYQMHHRDWIEDEIDSIKEAQNSVFPVFSEESAISLKVNISRLESLENVRVAPFSQKISHVFADLPKLCVLSPPESSQMDLMIELLSNL